MTDRQKMVLIDGRGHLLGRLASIVAKQILNGQRIVVVRCEEIDLSGSFFRNKLRYLSFLRKRTNTNPKHGPIHFRSPSKIFWRSIRGMLPHKQARGKAALSRLKTFEGIPAPYDKLKRMVCPEALRVVRLKPSTRYCSLGRLASEVGWHHAEVVTKLETQRKIRSKAYYERKKALNKYRSKAAENVGDKLAPINKELEKYGY
eukprot:TRINITY_DN1715_c0_g1_i1.p1 TRINITY_DN1715_c0_g1~~TRINITY_DN1715_c0_g1_i1.p1  ORF type:complete len:203 (-),score=21.32 TRINITY_DN1715_c0_g1_i1:81-689(-)